ncbi:unnamed protein product [Symbiodinium sp. CCMP2592]|nr:unnamed protein product [Symbiodinium sp. CCMP2592]
MAATTHTSAELHEAAILHGSLGTAWDTTTAEAHAKYNVSDHPSIWQRIADHCLPYSNGKVVADLGAGDGTLGKLLQARTMYNVDPFPPDNCSQMIVKSDGVEFLRLQPEQSLDLVVATFAVHFMDRASLDKELTRVLCPTGRAMWCSFSKTSMLFGNEDFNRLYYSVGFEKDGGASAASMPTSVLRISRPASYADLRNHIENRCHSNLKQMSDEMIAHLISLIPRDLKELDIRLDVFEFVPQSSRDGLVQCLPEALCGS